MKAQAVVLSLLIVPSCVFADGGAQEETSPPAKKALPAEKNEKASNALLDLETRLKQSFTAAADRARLADSESGKEASSKQSGIEPKLPPANAPKTPFDKQAGVPQIKDSDKMIENLVREVEDLRTDAVVSRYNQASTQSPRRTAKIGSKSVYSYREGQIYEIRCGVDRVTDIELKPGETLTNPPVSGDTVRWRVTVMTSGSPQGQVTHVILKPVEEDIDTNLILTTSLHVYHLHAVSGDTYQPSIKWSYPIEEDPSFQLALKKEATEETVFSNPEKLDFDYDISGDDPSWAPLRAFDDGSKTFIQMPEGMTTSEAPALFVLDEDNKPMLVNYRVKGRYYIVDRLFTKSELRAGDETVTVKRHHGFFFGLF